MERNRTDSPASPARLIAAVLAVLAALIPACPAADHSVPPLERTVRLDLWSAGLNDAAREIQQQTGVPVRFYRPDIPSSQYTGDLHLISGRVSLRMVMECLARRYGFRYRLSPDGALELSRSYDWVGDGPVLAFSSLDELVPSDGAHDGLSALIGEFVKARAIVPGENRIDIEKRPRPGNPAGLQCISALPPVLSDYFKRALACLAGSAGDYPPLDATYRPFARASRPEVDWQSLLLRPVRIPAGDDLRKILNEICLRTGTAVTVASFGPGTASSRPGVELSLGQATEELASRFGLGRRVFLADGAIAFEPGPGETWMMDGRRRELFWTGLAVAGFDARTAADRAGGGPALVSLIRREVFPVVWRDPVCAVGYSDVTGRMGVVAPFNVVAEVAARLEALTGIMEKE